MILVLVGHLPTYLGFCTCRMKKLTVPTGFKKVLAALTAKQAGWGQDSLKDIRCSVLQPNRTYYLMDPSGNAHKWCRKIQEVWRQQYQSNPDAAVQ